MFATPRKGKKGAKGGTKGRRKALTSDEAKALFTELVPPETPKKAIPAGLDIPEKDAVQKTITLEDKGLIPGRIIRTPVATKQYWDNNLNKWKQYMNQVQTYCLLNQHEINIDVIGIIFKAYLNYLTFQEAAELSNKVLENMELNAGFNKRPPQPTYNPVKGIPWLVKNWPEIEQYLMLGTLYELGTPEIEYPHDEEQEETIWIDEDPFIIKPPLGEGSGSGSKDRPQTPLNKGKGTEEQPQTPEKQKKDKPFPQKKKVQINPEPDLEPSSSSRSDDESGPDSDKSKSSDSEESGTETDRSVREITPKQKEWEKVTGIKQHASKIKEETIKKTTRLAKIKEPEAFDGKAEKWKDTITFDEYMEQLVRWLKWQGLDVEKEEALERASFQFTGMAAR